MRHAFSVVAICALVLSACGGPASAPAGDAGGPRPGGTLRFAVSSDAGCLDPQQVGSNDTIYSLRQVVDSLTDQDPATGELRPWLATGWEPNADATAYTFTLREGVTFSDGTPLDATAVKYRLPASPLDDLLLQQAAAADPAARSALAADAQRLIVENYYTVPVVELTTVLGVGPTTHDIRFDASSRIHLYDTWKSA